MTTQPSQAEVERAGRGRGAAAATRLSLAIVSLADGKVTTIPGIRSFRLPHDNATWLAYVAAPDSGTAEPGAGAARGGRGGRGGPAGGRRQFGSTLVLHNFSTGAEDRIALRIPATPRTRRVVSTCRA